MKTRTLRFKCDICGKELKNNPKELKPIYLACTEHDINNEGIFKTLYRADACTDCFDTYYDCLFNNFPHVDKKFNNKIDFYANLDNDLDTNETSETDYDGSDLDL